MNNQSRGQYGKPMIFYSDNASVFRVNNKHASAHLTLQDRLVKELTTAEVYRFATSAGFCYFAQSSSTNPGTRSNSLTLFVTSTAPTAMACPAIAVSFGPIGMGR
jgi:hypothetical protein